MSDEQDKLKLSLEPPKLFGRKKKSDAMGTSKSTSPAPAKRPSPASGPPTPADTEPDTEPDTEADTEATEEATDVVDEPTEVVEEPTGPEPVAEPAPVPEPEPEPATKKATPAKKTAPAKKAAPATKPAAASAAPAEETVPAKKPARPRAKLAPEIEPEPITAAHHDYDITEVEEDEGPLLPIYPAAAVTGALAGVTMVVLTWLSLRGCESIRGTASCGGGPGFLLLIATFVVCILLGSTLLKVFQIPDPGSSSFLGVGLVAVVSLLFLIDVLDHWSMLIVIPIISVGAFLASVWVTKTFVEPGEA